MINYLFVFNEYIPIFPLRIRMLYFFLILSKSTDIENIVQIWLILYSSQPIRLQLFFRVSDN